MSKASLLKGERFGERLMYRNTEETAVYLSKNPHEREGTADKRR